MMRGQPAAAQDLPAAAHQCIFSLSMHIYIYEFYHHVFNINICILLTQAGVLLTVHSFMNPCCRRRAAVLPPPLQEPPLVEGFELVGGEVERLVDEVAAIEGWRRMMMRFHRLFFKRRCFALLGSHLRAYRLLRPMPPSLPQGPT